MNHSLRKSLVAVGKGIGKGGMIDREFAEDFAREWAKTWKRFSPTTPKLFR